MSATSAYELSKNSQSISSTSKKTNTSETKLEKTESTKQPSVFSGMASISRSTSLYDLKDGSKYDGMDYLVGFGLNFNFGSFSSKLSYSQDLNDKTGENSSINDTNITYSYLPISISKNDRGVNLGWVPSVTMIIPLSDRSRNVEQLQTALIASAGLSLSAGKNTAMSGLGSKFSISLGQNFHQFETDKNGTISNKMSSNQSIALYYTLSDFTFSLAYANMYRWPYSGNVKNSFSLSQDITYSFLDQYSVSIGQSNSGSTLKPNGYDSNISLFSDTNSILYLAFGASF